MTNLRRNFIAIILSILAFLLMISFLNHQTNVNQNRIFLYYLIIVVITILFFILLLNIFKFIFQKQEKEIVFTTSQWLSHRDPHLVLFKPIDTSDSTSLMMQILRNVNCKFYAQLTEENQIKLVAIDKNNEKIFEDIIENVTFFNENFHIHD